MAAKGAAKLHPLQAGLQPQVCEVVNDRLVRPIVAGAAAAAVGGEGGWGPRGLTARCAVPNQPRANTAALCLLPLIV